MRILQHLPAVGPVYHGLIITNEHFRRKVVRSFQVRFYFFCKAFAVFGGIEVRNCRFQKLKSAVSLDKIDGFASVLLFFFRIRIGAGVEKPKATQHLRMLFRKCKGDVSTHTMTYHYYRPGFAFLVVNRSRFVYDQFFQRSRHAFHAHVVNHFGAVGARQVGNNKMVIFQCIQLRISHTAVFAKAVHQHHRQTFPATAVAKSLTLVFDFLLFHKPLLTTRNFCMPTAEPTARSRGSFAEAEKTNLRARAYSTPVYR